MRWSHEKPEPDFGRNHDRALDGRVFPKFLATFGMAAALAATPALGASDKKGHEDKKMQGGMKMKMASCERMVMVTTEAEAQLGGAHFKGKIPEKTGMQGMQGMKMGKAQPMKMAGDAKGMKGMKMAGDAKGMKGMSGAHADHDAKSGGVLFMAPNELHHVEGAFSPECGFQVLIFNAFTKPIGVERFRAFIKVSGEVDEEEVEAIRFLSPNVKKTILGAGLPHGLKPPFEVELFVKFPEGEEVELFNFAVDEQGKIS